MWLNPNATVGDPMLGLIIFVPIIVICMVLAVVSSIFLKRDYRRNPSFIWISMIGLMISIIGSLLINRYTLKTEIFLIWLAIVYLISLYIAFKKKDGL